jgi:hypothetical protein
MTLEDCQVKVVTENNMTENVNANVGVRQGDALSSLFV